MTSSNPEDVSPYETKNSSGVPGELEIAPAVIAAIVGHAAEQVKGVVRLGTGSLIRSVMNTTRSTESSKARGVEVEAVRREAIFDIELTVEYGHSVPEIVRAVRESVATQLMMQVGLMAKEVNVKVSAIVFPDKMPTGRVE